MHSSFPILNFSKVFLALLNFSQTITLSQSEMNYSFVTFISTNCSLYNFLPCVLNFLKIVSLFLLSISALAIWKPTPWPRTSSIPCYHASNTCYLVSFVCKSCKLKLICLAILWNFNETCLKNGDWYELWAIVGQIPFLPPWCCM